MHSSSTRRTLSERRRHVGIRRLGLALVALLLASATPAVTASATDATAETAPTTGADGLAELEALAPTMDCADVPDLDLSGVVDAPVTFESATVSDDGAAAPYCEVTGTIAPANTIVMRLPTEGWTQRYVQTGCGGLCGHAEIRYEKADTCPPVADGTVASATTDMGHQGQNDGSWAADNPQAQIDFSYRGVHVTAEVAKAVIRQFYGQRPVYSYFDGCSDGGREALMEAQRYPDDFDGIAAGAPANNMAVQNTFHHAWNVVTNRDENGDYILLADRLPMIHEAVLDACDDIDGMRDGLIDDPRNCHFDPATLICKDGQDRANCLSRAEAGVVRRLHDGAVGTHGRRLEPAISHEWGSELEWTLFIPESQGETVGSERFALSYLRYLAHPNDPDPDYELSDLEFDARSFWKTVMPSSSYMAAMDPDLGRFRRSGGKLLLWHGWNDQHISPQTTLAYYDTLRKKMGRRVADRFVELYLFPGMAHCGGGEGPDTFDILTPVMAWVESGKRPGRIVASKVADGATTRTRPVYPYPTVARYDGTGSIDDASNFGPFTPRHRHHSSDYRWIGKPLYSGRYQTRCRAVHGRLVCRPVRRHHGHGHGPHART